MSVDRLNIIGAFQKINHYFVDDVWELPEDEFILHMKERLENVEERKKQEEKVIEIIKKELEAQQ